MAPNKQCALDSVVTECFRFLEWGALDNIRNAFEFRLNGAQGHDDVVPAWTDILVTLLPKTSSSHRLTQLRPISLVSTLQKWYLACVTSLARNLSTPPVANLLGFEPTHQCMEISEFIRLLLQRAHEWGIPIFVGKGDISTAFDAIEHPILDAALESRSVPLPLRVAYLRELVEVNRSISLQGLCTPPVSLGKGGKQGSTETPCNWNCLLDFLLTPLILSWTSKKFGVDLGTASCRSPTWPGLMTCGGLLVTSLSS